MTQEEYQHKKLVDYHINEKENRKADIYFLTREKILTVSEAKRALNRIERIYNKINKALGI